MDCKVLHTSALAMITRCHHGLGTSSTFTVHLTCMPKAL